MFCLENALEQYGRMIMSMPEPRSSSFVYVRRRRRRLFGGWVGQSTLVSCYAFSSSSSLLLFATRRKRRLCFDLTKMVQQMRNIMFDAVVFLSCSYFSSCFSRCHIKSFCNTQCHSGEIFFLENRVGRWVTTVSMV